MMRVLHLIDAAGFQATGTTLALMAESLGRLGATQQQVLLAGPPAFEALAHQSGVTATHRVAVPNGQAVLGWPRIAAAIRAAVAGGVDLVHCWSVGTLSVATTVLPRVPKLLTVTAPPSHRGVHWLRFVISESRAAIALLPLSNTVRRTLLEGGVAASAVHVLRPGIDQGRVRHTTRALLRESWDAADPNIRVVALLSDPATSADAHHASLAALLASDILASRRRAPSGEQQPRLRLLVHPDQRNRLRAQRMARDVGQGHCIVQEPRVGAPWEILPGCDAALCVAGYSGLSLLWAMAANVPIIAEATYAASEVVEDHHSALLAKADRPASVAHRLTELLPDKMLAWKLRDTARHEAFSFFSRQRYCQSLQVVYEQIVAGQPIQVPAMEVTGGLRFAGRAG
jgi:hypothetical protein